MKVYQDTLRRIIDEGSVSFNRRTDSRTFSLFDVDHIYDIGDKCPMPTTKQGYFKGATTELAWVLKGLTNTDYLHKHGVHFWDQWALKGGVVNSVEDIIYMYQRVHGKHTPELYEVIVEYRSSKGYHYLLDNLGMLDGPRVSAKYNDTAGTFYNAGDLGPVYGKMLREFPNPDGTTTDQLKTVVESLTNNPSSRRHLVSLWCPYYLPDESLSPQENVLNGKQALAPCHWAWTFKTEETPVGEIKEGKKPYKLNLHLIMRSNDYPVGNPVNIVFYYILLRLMAQTVNMEAGKLRFTSTDTHVYDNQLKGCETVLEREPMELPTLVLDPEATVFNFEPEMARLENYTCHPKVEFKVAT